MTPAEHEFNRKISNKRKDCSNLTVATQKENGEKSEACVVSYNIPYMERPAIKGTANQKKKNCASCQIPCVATADTVLTECHVKILISISKKLVRVQMLSNTLYNLHIYIDADYKKHNF